MKMYVANATRQTVNFMYRLPDNPGMKSHFIPVGKQLLLPVDLSQKDIDYIVEYNGKYGFTEASAIDRTRPFIGLCYSTDKPVPPPRLHSAMEHNIEVMKERGQQNRQLAAIAAEQSLEKSLENTPGLAELESMEMTIVEETKAGFSTRRDAVSEGFHVSRSITEDQNGQAGRGAREQRRGGKKKRG